jgi:hypothetical protein
MICEISNKNVHCKIINNSINYVMFFLDFINSIPNIKKKIFFLDNT